MAGFDISGVKFVRLILKMEAVCSYEMLLSAYKSTRRYNPEDQHRHKKVLFVAFVKCEAYKEALKFMLYFM
jgi:hypothetical protein